MGILHDEQKVGQRNEGGQTQEHDMRQHPRLSHCTLVGSCWGLGRRPILGVPVDFLRDKRAVMGHKDCCELVSLLLFPALIKILDQVVNLKAPAIVTPVRGKTLSSHPSHFTYDL